MIVVLGAGIAGLSAAFHIGHERSLLLERQPKAGGHTSSYSLGGFTWDQGPHVSFTKNEAVKALFAEAVDGEYDEYPVRVGNYHRGHWIEHPAQTALHAVPEPLRQRCLDSFLSTRQSAESLRERTPTDYGEWLDRAFGPVFAKHFPAPYTRKYWTREPRELTTDWVGGRVHLPTVADVVEGSLTPLEGGRHYISKVRYPKGGGYEAFTAGLRRGANLRCSAEVARIDLRSRTIGLSTGESIAFDRLVNTMPLPVFIDRCINVPASVREAVRALECSRLLLVETTAPHPTRRPENWLYVYDEDKLSTRIHFTERLTPGNAPPQHTGVQVEVYVGRQRPCALTHAEVAQRVLDELVEMRLIDADAAAQGTVYQQVRRCQWANVIFDHARRDALDRIWSWLETEGLGRRDDDLTPTTDWSLPRAAAPRSDTLFMAGRFAQWKYYWSDDCVLRGRQLASEVGR